MSSRLDAGGWGNKITSLGAGVDMATCSLAVLRNRDASVPKYAQNEKHMLSKLWKIPVPFCASSASQCIVPLMPQFSLYYIPVSSIHHPPSLPFNNHLHHLSPPFASSSHCTPTHSSTHPHSPPPTRLSAQSLSQTPKITVPHSMPSSPSSSTSSSAMA